MIFLLDLLYIFLVLNFSLPNIIGRHTFQRFKSMRESYVYEYVQVTYIIFKDSVILYMTLNHHEICLPILVLTWSLDFF